MTFTLRQVEVVVASGVGAYALFKFLLQRFLLSAGRRHQHAELKTIQSDCHNDMTMQSECSRHRRRLLSLLRSVYFTSRLDQHIPFLIDSHKMIYRQLVSLSGASPMLDGQEDGACFLNKCQLETSVKNTSLESTCEAGCEVDERENAKNSIALSVA